MSNFLKKYLEDLRNSDENTKHRSAMTISIILSIIILSIAFTLMRGTIFNFSKDNSEVLTGEENPKNEIVSPIQSIKNFFSQTGREISSVKSTINTTVGSEVSTTSSSSSEMINNQDINTSTSSEIDNATPVNN